MIHVPYGINCVIYPPLPYDASTPVAYTVLAIAGSAQNPRPVASLVRTFPTAGVPQEILTCQTISRVAVGDVVPIQTFHPL